MFSLSSSEDYFLEEADSNIQANLEDSVVQEALKSGEIFQFLPSLSIYEMHEMKA